MADANYEWKHAFKKNRVKIVKELANPDAVAGQLFQSAILNSEMHELIIQMKEREQKTRNILDTLNYRSKNGVAALHDAFMETENKDLANVLAPYVIAVAKIASKTEPNEWPPSNLEDIAMTKEHVIKIKDKNSPWFVHEYGKESVYDMKGECRGNVFIINNISFGKNWPVRKSSSTDANNLTQLFKELHFTVTKWDNLTAKQMEYNLCSAVKEIQEKQNIECVVLIILSHGGGTRIYGVDCMPVELKTLTDCFSTANCPILHGKPRLVFVQACRSVEIATIEETSHVVKHDDDVPLECIINTNQPILEIFWTRDLEGAEQNIKDVTDSKKYRRESRKNSERLIVNKVEENDKGKYKCVVKYESEYRSNPSELKLDVENSETASIKRTVYSVKPGTTELIMECTVRTSKQIKEVFWEKDDECKNGDCRTFRDTKISEKYHLDSHTDGATRMHSLTINGVRASDHGKYRCVIEYYDGSKDQSNLTELEVDLQDGEIAFMDKNNMHFVKPGGQVEIKCNVNTNKPISAVFWEKDTGNVKDIITEKTDPKKYCLQQVGITRNLTIKNVDIGDIGNYRCIVKYESIFKSNPSELELDVKHEDASKDVKEKESRATTTQESYDERDSEPYQQKPVPYQKKPVENKAPKPTFLDHPSSDFLIAYATPEGTKAWLHGTVGSWFMNAIVWTFKYHAHEEELHHLLIRVNRLVGKGCTWSNDMTVAEVKSNLRKKLYFFPGIYGNPAELFKDKEPE